MRRHRIAVGVLLVGLVGLVGVSPAVAGSNRPAAPASVLGEPQTLKFTPVADTYVDQSQPLGSFGSDIGFWVDADPIKQSFVKFDVSGIANRTISDVRLRLFQTDSSTSGGRVWSMTNTSWTESITWNDRPPIDGAQLGSYGAVSNQTWYEADLGPTAVTSEGLVSFAIDSADVDGARWASRENASQPQLLVDLAPVSVDSFAFTPIADTYVDASMPTTSFGTTTSMWVDSNPQKISLLKFKLGTFQGRTVIGAHLRLYQIDSSAEGGQVWQTTNTWNEGTTWNTKPPLSGSSLGSFGPVSTNQWYSSYLNVVTIFPPNGTVSFAITSPNPDGALWKTREDARAPQLILDVGKSTQALDGLSTVAGTLQGSGSPTEFASNRRLAITSGGRLLTVYGLHVTGVQLAWRDPAGNWQTTSQGDVTDGLLEDNGTTGDRPASIAVAKDPSGQEHAWVVWTGTSGIPDAIFLRRLSNLDSADGPSVGPLVTLVPVGLGNSRADLAFEVGGDGVTRGVVVWTQQTDAATYQVMTGWITDLTTDTPTLGSTTALLSASTSARVATLVPTSLGMRAVARGDLGKMEIFTHDKSAPLTTWSAGALGVGLAQGSYPSGVALSTGEVLSAVESNTTNHTVTIERFTASGTGTSIDLTVSGYAQPTIASDGSNAWVVMRNTTTGTVVSRKYTSGSGWATTDTVEIGTGAGGGYGWPNLIRGVDSRLRFVLQGKAASTSQRTVLAFQRVL